jgi:hypothetical protein
MGCSNSKPTAEVNNLSQRNIKSINNGAGVRNSQSIAEGMDSTLTSGRSVKFDENGSKIEIVDIPTLPTMSSKSSLSADNTPTGSPTNLLEVRTQGNPFNTATGNNIASTIVDNATKCCPTKYPDVYSKDSAVISTPQNNLEVRPADSGTDDGCDIHQTYPSKLFNRNVSYKEINLSPTCKISIDNAEEKMFDDGIPDQIKDLFGIDILSGNVDEDAAQEEKKTIKQCLLYIYGNEFFVTKNKGERIDLVLKSLTRENKCRQRLYMIALADTKDRIIRTKNESTDLYYVALTVRAFFDQKEKNVFGKGFTKKPFLRIQRSNNCFLVAACVYYSLALQLQYPNDDTNRYPIDIGEAGRRFVLNNDTNFVSTVIKDEPRQMYPLAVDLTQTNNEDDSVYWSYVSFKPRQSMDVHNKCQHVKDYLDVYGVGLVTEFKLHKAFQQTRKKRRGAGYLLFDGREDCDGTWIKMETTTLQQEKTKRELDIVPEGEVLFVDDDGRSSTPTKTSALATEETYSPSTSLENSKKDTDRQTAVAEYHAMVVIGGYEENGKYYFLLLNWWIQMPLLVVSEDYLQCAQPKIRFFEGLFPKPGDSMTFSGVQYAEAAFPFNSSNAVCEGSSDDYSYCYEHPVG